jgi:hypothetical protein
MSGGHNFIVSQMLTVGQSSQVPSQKVDSNSGKTEINISMGSPRIIGSVEVWK